MQVSANVSSSTVAANLQADAVAVNEQQNRYEDYKVIRRNGGAYLILRLTPIFVKLPTGAFRRTF